MRSSSHPSFPKAANSAILHPIARPEPGKYRKIGAGAVLSSSSFAAAARSSAVSFAFNDQDPECDMIVCGREFSCDDRVEDEIRSWLDFPVMILIVWRTKYVVSPVSCGTAGMETL